MKVVMKVKMVEEVIASDVSSVAMFFACFCGKIINISLFKKMILQFCHKMILRHNSFRK